MLWVSNGVESWWVPEHLSRPLVSPGLGALPPLFGDWVVPVGLLGQYEFSDVIDDRLLDRDCVIARGRPRLSLGGSASGDLGLWLDRASGLVLRRTRQSDGGETVLFVVDSLVIDGPVADSSFDEPPGRSEPPPPFPGRRSGPIGRSSLAGTAAGDWSKEIEDYVVHGRPDDPVTAEAEIRQAAGGPDQKEEGVGQLVRGPVGDDRHDRSPGRVVGASLRCRRETDPAPPAVPSGVAGIPGFRRFVVLAAQAG
jgi:hypothetical protein